MTWDGTEIKGTFQKYPLQYNTTDVPRVGRIQKVEKYTNGNMNTSSFLGLNFGARFYVYRQTERAKNVFNPTCDVTEHVIPGDVLLREPPVTNVASERPNAAVHEAVALEVTGRRKRLVAHLALVRLLLER